ncbi:DUF3795 domain-containing protein [Oscillibacter sp.]|uniref:DUF3795 domain-containing protein n=1 Tax=Oscillibacter sp. TaxID=1945593 RepID=UPI002D8075A2|nr:DUF3795 domain-containing protein [Oscillibacter sp.]
METICGKSCESCGWKDQLNCAGCREDMGRPFSGPCGIAACCREKGHERCVTCTYFSLCSRRAGRDDVPRQELQRRDGEEAKQRRLAETAPLMAKWTWLMFWLVVPSELAGLLTVDFVAQAFPAAEAVGTALRFLCGLAYALFLWKLTPVLRSYRTAALCQLVVVLMYMFLPVIPEGSGLFFLLGVPSLLLSLYGDYVEFFAHAQAVEPLDAELAANWRKLWKLLLISIGSLFLFLLSLFMGPFVAMFVGLAALALAIYYAVMRMVYLWRTAKRFREWTPPALPGPSPEL